jgi:serine protease Do
MLLESSSGVHVDDIPLFFIQNFSLSSTIARRHKADHATGWHQSCTCQRKLFGASCTHRLEKLMRRLIKLLPATALTAARAATLAATLAALLTAAFAATAVAAVPNSSAAPSTQDIVNALTQAQEAVVGIQVTAAEGARSSATLGRQRSGSGVVINAEGLILTIGYLIMEADMVQVVTQEKKQLPARVVAYDLATGFGLVQPIIPLRGIKPVKLGDTKDHQAGEALMAGLGAGIDASGRSDADVSMTQLVSKKAFSGYWEYHIDTALFTSPPVGNNHSGAPLFNQKGELLGVGSLFIGDVSSKDFPGRLPGNMFVPVDLLKPIMAEMLKTGTSQLSRRPWLGLTSSEQGGRVQIVRVNSDGPAQTAGLKAGDVILAVDEAKVANLESFYKKVWARDNPEGEVKLTVLQGADIKTITLKAVDRMNTMRKPAGI